MKRFFTKLLQSYLEERVLMRILLAAILFWIVESCGIRFVPQEYHLIYGYLGGIAGLYILWKVEIRAIQTCTPSK